MEKVQKPPTSTGNYETKLNRKSASPLELSKWNDVSEQFDFATATSCFPCNWWPFWESLALFPIWREGTKYYESWLYTFQKVKLTVNLILTGCPAGWYGFGNSCYLFRVRSLSLIGLNWDNARSYCLSYGGDLVSVANKSEMDFIYSRSSKARNEHFWIGLNDRRNESLFVWSDGTPYNHSVYHNWYPGEPNDRAGEDCVELFGRRWNDDSCKKEYSYICERPKGRTPVTA